MVTIVKHEWHQVDSQFAYELERETLEEIYPDMDEDELDVLWEQVEAGEADLDEILNEAWNQGVDIDWDHVQEIHMQDIKRRPIVVDENGWVLDGNHRATAARAKGLDTIPALVPYTK